jgi:hypothetical protein
MVLGRRAIQMLKRMEMHFKPRGANVPIEINGKPVSALN